MRIGIDARELTGRPTGVGRYLSGLIHEWSRSADAARHQFILYAHRPLTARAGETQGGERGSFEIRIVGGRGGTLWEQRDLARAVSRDRVDVLFSPAYSTPLLTRVPRVVALHDVSFAARPEWFSWREGVRRRGLARGSARAARAVITISQFSRREIVAHFGIAADRIHVIPPGIDRAGADGRLLDHGSDTVLLFVGSIFNRRHVPDLIAAFGAVARRRPDALLHLVGDNRTYPHQDIAAAVANQRLAERLQWHEYVSDDRLLELYARARGFVFLSEYEGLGLTPLEAISAGVPPLLLDTAVARESCGEAALYAPALDAATLAEWIERLLYDAATRRALLSAAPAVLARYDWRRSAANTLGVLVGAAA